MQNFYRPSQPPAGAAWNANPPQPLNGQRVRAIAASSIWQGLAAAALIFSATNPKVHAQVSAFSYQGRLDVYGAPANGAFDFAFTLHDAPATGAPLGSGVTTNGIPITNGLFSVVLDFGMNAFNGGSRWLNIAVRTNGGSSFSALSPRQQVTPSPYAIHAGSSGVAAGLKGSGATLLANGNLGLGVTQPTVRLSLGNDSAIEKLALVDAPAGRTTGFGVSNDVFRVHLGVGANRFSILNDASSVTPLVSITKDGSIENYSETGTKRVVIGAPPGRPGNGSVTVHDSAGTEKASMVVDAAGKGKLTCDYIQINGGADIAEPFEVRHDSTIQPGMVVAIDPQRPGELRLSDRAYDSAVAGIISGANGILPGLMLQQIGTPATGKYPVALSGRVWCYCDVDAGGAILPGDLLTSANEPGHAMKATDRNRAPGAVIGKAMTPLPRGKGLVLVLVSLQ